MTNVGSRPATMRPWAIMAETVPLPWVPVTPTLSVPRRQRPSISLRWASCRPFSRAATRSRLSFGTAVEWTTTSAPSTFSARCPMVTGMPRARSPKVS